MVWAKWLEAGVMLLGIAISVATLFFSQYLKSKQRIDFLWKLGVIAIAFGVFTFMFEVNASLSTVRPVGTFSGYWLPIGLAAIFSGIVGLVWAMWWKRRIYALLLKR